MRLIGLALLFAITPANAQNGSLSGADSGALSVPSDAGALPGTDSGALPGIPPPPDETIPRAEAEDAGERVAAPGVGADGEAGAADIAPESRRLPRGETFIQPPAPGRLQAPAGPVGPQRPVGPQGPVGLGG